MTMTPDQEKSIVANIPHLTQRTSNLKALGTELLQHGVITLAERAEIAEQQNIEGKAKLLYEIVLKKSPVCFKLLMKCLRCSGNENLAKLIEDTLGETKRGKMIYRRSSSTADRYIREDVGNTLIEGREMGIAEIFEEDSTFSQNWKNIFYLLNLSEQRLSFVEGYGNFTVKATIMLRDWGNQEKLKGSLSNLMESLDKRGHQDTAIRIKRMFEDFSAESESGFLLSLQCSTPLPMCRTELIEVARVIEDNPDFALHWEKLFLLLQLPMEYFQQFSIHSSFVEKAIGMLQLWKEVGKDDPTYFDLARLLVQNGHRNTGGKILVLGAM